MAALKRSTRPAGGWLVTYADLMTILVCFFVLIISYSIQDKVKMEVVAGSLRDAFGVAEQRRFAGDIKLEGTPERRQPGNVRPVVSPSADGLTDTLSALPGAGLDGAHGAYSRIDPQIARRHRQAKEALEKAILTHPLLKDAAETITISLSETGMQVILADNNGSPMFELGSTQPTPIAEAALREIATILTPLPNRIFLEGHADSVGGNDYESFELTAARANAARKIIESSGFPRHRIAGVSGRADADLLFPENPFAPGNRRIEILLEPAAPLLPPDRTL